MAHPEAIKVLSSGSAREPMVPRFADPAHEAAFKQRYAEQRRSQDYFLLTVRCKWRMIAHPPRARHNSVPARLGARAHNAVPVCQRIAATAVA